MARQEGLAAEQCSARTSLTLGCRASIAWVVLRGKYKTLAATRVVWSWYYMSEAEQGKTGQFRKIQKDSNYKFSTVGQMYCYFLFF